MPNVLNSIIANQPIYPQKEEMPAYTFDTKGKIKPMKDKGTLLPSRIFGSPVEYVKDLKKDILSIGKASKGQANDHELGRINDIAMKLGSLGIAAYLFTKNPIKLNKVMQFVGFGTFFGSMALWPKLAIQAPLRARTGVDIHQKYIDSQGRKKMLYQDPQYVLTDLYSKEDLEKIGDKLGVSKDIPDRDNFIKQRAQKVALQGNTLWMMTAGIASPVMSALACNQLERPISAVMEKAEMVLSERALKSGKYQGFWGNLKQKISDKLFERFLAKNADRVLDDKFIQELSTKVGGKLYPTLGSEIVQEISALKGNVVVDMNFVRTALQGRIKPEVFEVLSASEKAALETAIKNKAFTTIGNILAKAATKTTKEQKTLAVNIAKDLTTKADARPTLGKVAGTVRKLYVGLRDFAKGKVALDRFITSRVGEESGTYIANEWNRFGRRLMKSLHLSMKELKELADGKGDFKIIAQKMEALAKSDKADKFDKTILKLMKQIGKYEERTGQTFLDIISEKSSEICGSASQGLREQGFSKVAEAIATTAENKSGTIQNSIQNNAIERASGFRSCCYRVMQSLGLFKKANNEGESKLKEQIRQALKKHGQKADKNTVGRLEDTCKHILLSATTTDHVEKFTTSGFELSKAEYKAVMDVIKDTSEIEKSLSKTIKSEKAKGIVQGMKKHLEVVREKVANWQNNITTEHSKRVAESIEGAAKISNATERNNLVGDPVRNMIRKFAKDAYNSKKWFRIFGGTMLALTVATLIIGRKLGQKSETEKQAEAESKRNV